jgi:hypothetical protein
MALEGSEIQRVSSTPHPSLKFQQHQLIRTFNQGQVVDRAVAVASVVQGEMEVVTAEATDFRIAADHHIQGRTEPGHSPSEFGPGHRHGG